MRNKKYPVCFVLFLIQLLFVSPLSLSAYGQSLEDRILGKLNLTEGMIIADVGTGGGEFAVKMAVVVGPEGHVYANEIDRSKIQRIESRIKSRGIENITTVLGEEEDAVLPVKVDLMVLKYVYHHLDKPGIFMTNLLKYLNPDGMVAVIAVDNNHVSRERATRENRDACISDPEETKKAIEKSGFKFEKREDVKTDREVEYILFFRPARRG